MFRVIVVEMLRGQEEPFDIKTYEYENIDWALETALYYEEEDGKQFISSYNIVSVEELKNGEWREWRDSEGHKFNDYTLWNGKVMLME